MAVSQNSIATRVKTELEKIQDWPTPGVQLVILDMRFINAIAQALFDTLTQDVDVIPTGHGGNLQNPIGQSVNIPSTSSPGSPSVGATDAASTITGKGKLA